MSEFPPPRGRWIPYRVDRGLRENYAAVEARLDGAEVRFLAVVLQPRRPYGYMRWLPVLMAPHRTLFYNENLDHFTLRPRSLPHAARHIVWRTKEFVTWQFHPGGDLYTWLWRLRRPSRLRRPFAYARALSAGRSIARRKQGLPQATVPILTPLPAGISVVVPSRSGRALLAGLLPRLDGYDEIIVVDNGSEDGTAEWLASEHPSVRVEHSEQPMSFARAINRGLSAVRFSHVCLLNNDMRPAPNFLRELLQAFDEVPDLFCATAQIFFPEGKRREETGKAVMPPGAEGFPIHCVEPLPEENFSYVLYGSGGCSLFSTAMARALGGLGEMYEPAYVEDLDFGVRAWAAGWPTVFVSRAHTVHEHRATTSRYYEPEELDYVLERNYLRFLSRSIGSPEVFGRLWRAAIDRLNRKAALEHHAPSLRALQEAREARKWLAPTFVKETRVEESLLALGSGDVAVFPGNGARTGPVVLIASCYIPFPLSHGGAVRMYNLMRRAVPGYTQVLITFVDELHAPPRELLDICAEIVQVRRVGSHVRADTGRPDVVEDFDQPAFHAALEQTKRKWHPRIAQLEFTQMAAYADDCHPARTLLVEHDVTIDLYRQILHQKDDWELRRQLERWERFETAAWRNVDCVVTMSEKDRRGISNAKDVVALANGVDLERFVPSDREPERTRLLFIGSFAHLPNLLALDFFLADVWPLLKEHAPTLHVIAGSRHEYFYDRSREQIRFSLNHPSLEVEGFVADVRPAYERATAVIAPLLASAGTNIKVMEAMAMGKAIVSTTGGINGLDELTPGVDVLVEDDAAAMAMSIGRLFSDESLRRRIERAARATAERVYDWDVIAGRQRKLYERLIAGG